MLKSATGLCTEPRRSASARAAGFTLIEILVVIVILAIMAGMVLLSMGTLRPDDPTGTEARRIRALLELLSEEALIQGRDYGVEFFADGYRFLSWDPDTRLWTVIDDEEALRRRALPDGMRTVLAVDGREVVTQEGGRERPQDELVPQVAIFSSGEFTPFELFLVTEFVADAWVLRGEMRGHLELVGPDSNQ